MTEIKKEKEKIKGNSLFKGIALGLILALIVLVVLPVSLKSKLLSLSSDNGSFDKISELEAEKITKDFVGNILLGGQGEFEIGKIIEESNFFKADISVAGNVVPVYLTKDGKYFSKDLVSIQKVSEEFEKGKKKSNESFEKTLASISKKEKSKVEIFVMSYCPYGLQMQKGILPVMELMKDEADIEFKYVDFAMHGKEELDENMNQYCIAQEEKDKEIDYLDCFVGSQDSEKCMKKAGIDEEKIEKCVAKVDKKYEVSKLFADKSTWGGGKYPQFNVHHEEAEKYKIQGSPSLVVNGELVKNVPRDSSSLLKVVCAGFKNEPDVCKKELSSDAASASGSCSN